MPRQYVIVVIYLMLISALDLRSSDGARILMTSSQLPSHVMMQTAVGEELLRRGHEVYIVLASRYPHHETIAQLGIRVLQYVYPDDVLFATSDHVDRLFVDYIFSRKYGTEGRTTVGKMVSDECWYMLSDVELLATVRSLNFDLALVEPFIVLPCSPLLPHLLGIPFVSMTHYYVPWIIRQPVLPSFYAVYSTLIGTSPMPDLQTFSGRVANTLAFYGAQFTMLPMLWCNKTLLNRFAPSLASWEQLVSESQLFLLTVDYRLDSPMPIFPNVILVAGVTARDAKPLDGKLGKLFEEADGRGVIIVSFGSIANHLPAHIVAKFFQAFSQINETVVAKLPRSALGDAADVPSNVVLVSWLPQNDALGHLNTKLFITHCGNNGHYEAVYHGVPTLGFPMFADQVWNCNRAVRHGVGLCMDVVDFTITQLVDNIRTLIDDRAYRERVTRMSAAWRDELLVGRTKAAFWIDHVIRHGGQHLRSSPAASMPLYKFLMLDVIACGLVLFTFVGFFVALCGCLLVRKMTQKKLKTS